MKASRTFPRRFQNVIRHARIGAGNTIKDVIEWNLSAMVRAAEWLPRYREPAGESHHHFNGSCRRDPQLIDGQPRLLK